MTCKSFGTSQHLRWDILQPFQVVMFGTMKTLNSTPLADGFRMPGEFEPHTGCWMLWPERPDNWRLNALPAQANFVEVASAISQFERVTVGVTTTHYQSAFERLPRNIDLKHVAYDDIWVRDTGPVFVTDYNGIIRGVDWEFNSWGGEAEGLFASWEKDNAVARQILEIENIDRYKSTMVLEGGAVHVDGEGTLITTEECLLNRNRNPNLSRLEVETQLKQFLGVSKIIWLKRGVYLDETGGHVDNLCCFVRPGVVALTWTDDKTDPQYEISEEAFDILQCSEDASGRKLEVHRIHQPGTMYISLEESQGVKVVEGTIPRRPGDRLPASYINFYVANQGVILPVFNDPLDANAQEVLATLYPDKVIVPIYSRELLLGGGGIHCIVQQIPHYSTRRLVP